MANTRRFCCDTDWVQEHAVGCTGSWGSANPPYPMGSSANALFPDQGTLDDGSLTHMPEPTERRGYEPDKDRMELKYLVPTPWTEDARVIVSVIMPAVLTLFLQKNRKYAEVENGYDLGSKGIIPDLNRKIGILKARLWDGEPEVGESTDEVIDDLIGHLLLMKAKRRHE